MFHVGLCDNCPGTGITIHVYLQYGWWISGNIYETQVGPILLSFLHTFLNPGTCLSLGAEIFQFFSSHFIVTYLPTYYYCIATLSWNAPDFRYLLFLIAKFSILTLVWGHKTHTNLSLSKNIQYKEKANLRRVFLYLISWIFSMSVVISVRFSIRVRLSFSQVILGGG